MPTIVLLLLVIHRFLILALKVDLLYASVASVGDYWVHIEG